MLQLMIVWALVSAGIIGTGEFSLDTGLWRHSQTRSAAAAADEQLNAEHNPASIRGDVPQRHLTDPASDTLIDLAAQVVGTTELSDEFSGAAERGGISRDTNGALDDLQLSDWDRALVSSTGRGAAEELTREGPSMVSIMVGVVGLIVVCGTYLKGRN